MPSLQGSPKNRPTFAVGHWIQVHFQGTSRRWAPTKTTANLHKNLERRYLFCFAMTEVQSVKHTLTFFHQQLSFITFWVESGQQTLSNSSSDGFHRSLFAQKTLSPRSGWRLWPFHLNRINEGRVLQINGKICSTVLNSVWWTIILLFLSWIQWTGTPWFFSICFGVFGWSSLCEKIVVEMSIHQGFGQVQHRFRCRKMTPYRQSSLSPGLGKCGKSYRGFSKIAQAYISRDSR